VSIDITPPFDCTIRISPPKPLASSPLFQPVEIGRDDRLQIGVERCCRQPLEFADLGQDFGGRRDIGIGPDRAHRLDGAHSFSLLA
jgi:hypothetical protein